MNNVAVKTKDSTIQMSKAELDAFRGMFGIPDQTILTQLLNKFSEAVKILAKQNEDIVTDTQIKYREFADTMSDAIKELTKATAANTAAIMALKGNTAIEKYELPNPLFYSTMSADKQAFWCQKMTGIIAGRCMDSEQNKGNIHKAIYDGMKKDNGYDVVKLLKEYNRIHPDENLTILDMCSRSDALRIAYQNQIDRICNNKIVTKSKRKRSVTYKESHSCPKEMLEIISGISSTGNARGRTFNKAKRILIDRCDLDTAKIIKQIKKKYNIKDCNLWFAVSHYPELVDALKEAAKGE